MKKIKLKNRRLIIQISILVIAIVSATTHQLESIGKSIPWVSESLFHYICPTCGVTSIYQFFASPTIWADKVKSTLGIIIGLVAILSILFGPILCGFICPFGTIQDLVAKIGKKMFKGKYDRFLPEKLDSKIKYLRYVALIGAIILTATSGVMILESVNPYHAFLGIFNAKSISLLGLFILCLVIVVSLFVQRPWCKYLCPYGAFLGIFNKFKVFRVVRNNDTCVNCKKCNRVCQMGIEITNKEAVRDLSCISCLECVNYGVCPKEETIAWTSKDMEEISYEVITNSYEIEIEEHIKSNSKDIYKLEQAISRVEEIDELKLEEEN